MRSALIAVLLRTVWVAAAVTSCQQAWSEPASSPLDKDLYQIDVPLNPGTGIVAVRVVANRWPAMFLGRLGDLHVRNVSTGKESILKDRAPPCFEEELYVGALPAGAYELRAFENFFAGGWISGSQTLKVSTAPGPFHISAQRLTDLGTMVFLRPLFPLESREFRFALEPSELAITRLQAFIDSVARDPMLAAEPFSDERKVFRP